MKQILIILFCLWSLWVSSATLLGRVVDSQGEPISYATIYLVEHPVIGTATNDNGEFSLDITDDEHGNLIVSFLGYEKQEIPIGHFSQQNTIVLKEQPIALEETVISAKKSKQKNKRKAMTQLLHQVYVQLEKDMSKDNVAYRIVSDVKMDSEQKAWGMEQMIARIVEIPCANYKGGDSIQFAGEYCKRYFKSELRGRADTILAHKELNKRIRHAATEIDSGVIVHKGLWQFARVQDHYTDLMDEVKRWSVGNENEGEMVLTYTKKKNILGIFKLNIAFHYIVESTTYRLKRTSQNIHIYVNIPFGYKLKGDNLEILNLLNMSDQEIEKFRLKKMDATIKINTIYQKNASGIVPQETNLETTAQIISNKNVVIPLHVTATQRVVQVQAKDVKPMTSRQMTRRVKREIVPIY